jgi:polyhydroxybutyrate depolymerase
VTTRASMLSMVTGIAAAAALLAGCASVPGIDDAIEPITPRGGLPKDQGSVPPPATGPARPSWGCGENADLSPFDGKKPVASESAQREMLVHIPEGLPAGEPVPLVLDFHGLATNAELQSAITKWKDLADREKFIVAQPQGLNGSWAFLPEDGKPDGTADVTYVKAVVFSIAATRCVDVSRIYATGLSMGSLLSSLLACKAPEVFAAFGFVAGIQFKPDCEKAPPRPAVVFWGTKDCVLPWFGGLGPCLAIGPPGRTQPTGPVPPGEDGGFPPVEQVLAQWAAHNGCSGDPQVRSLSAAIAHRVYQDCRPDAGLELYLITDGAHAWPGSELMAALDRDPAQVASMGSTTKEIDATAIIWQFFQRYQINP